MRYCARVLVASVLVATAVLASAATKLVDAVVAEVTERGFVLTVGTEPLVVEDESATRFWKAKAPAERTGFKSGDLVRVRLKTDAAPTVLREMADRNTFAWLEKIRKEPVSGKVKKVDDRYVTLDLQDGSQFSFRATEKSDVVIGGQKVPATDLKEGTPVWVKARTLPNLDTWLVQLTDKPITVATKAKAPSKAKPKAVKIALEGALQGVIEAHLANYRMIDLICDGRLMHVTYTAQTRFFSGGSPGTVKSLARGQKATVYYKRDAFGRIIATKVELS